MVKASKKWLITGGCGFIGRALIKELLIDGMADAIRIVDNLSAGTRDDLAGITSFFETDVRALQPIIPTKMVQLVQSDVRDLDTALRASKGADVIVHLAANTGVLPSIRDPQTDMQVNVTGTFNYLEAARRNAAGLFIFASSGAPIGNATPPIHEEMACHPISPYGASKLAGEAYCSAYHGSFGLKAVSLRFSNVYGPLSGHKKSVVAKFIKEALQGKTWIINGDGSQTRDFLYVDDLVNAILLAVENGRGGEIYQIATQKETPIIEMARILKQILKETTGIDTKIRNSAPLTGDVPRSYANIVKAKNQLGWLPRTDLQSGLQKTIHWFVKEYDRRAPCAPHENRR
jgi:UDP-glucose 4-epimerase